MQLRFRRGLLALLPLFATPLIRSQILAPDTPALWQPTHLPFSFLYAGEPSSVLLRTWKSSTVAIATPNTRLYSFLDPATHLRVTAEVRLYPDFPGAVDYLLRFRNEGSADTPILESILPLDWSVPSTPGEATLRHARGSTAAADDFAPIAEPLAPDAHLHLESALGDSSSGMTLPFFNLQTGPAQGLIAAIGWTGNWKAELTRAGDARSIHLSAGMKATHLLLHPGEEIRTPRIVLLGWSSAQGQPDWQHAQNRWRRLLLAHYVPQLPDQPDGHPLPGPIPFASWGSEPIADKLALIRWVHDSHIPVDTYAIDAGWYGASIGAETDPTNPWWKNRGDWFPSPLYYPHGLEPLGDALHQDGLGFSLWVEPETAMPGTQIATEHPSWFLVSDRAGTPGPLLANLGDPTVRRGITHLLSTFITRFQMTWYRQDFNIPPERYWQLADTPDRIGLTESAYITGLYATLDELLATHPGLRIDNCASGGRRLDIEMMRRTFAVWRTDYGIVDTLADQAMTQALAPWVPQNLTYETALANTPWQHPGPYSTPESLYRMRLAYNAGLGIPDLSIPYPNNLAWITWIQLALAEYRETQPFFYADFFPILPYSLAEETWSATQWNRPQQKDGLVIALRRPDSPFSTLTLDLHDLALNATYQVEIRRTMAKAPAVRMKGSDLAHLQLTLSNTPDSALIFYRREP